MIHLQTKAKEIVDKLNREGFYGVPMNARMEADAEADGLTREQYEAHLRDLAYFLVDPDFDCLRWHGDDRYVSHDVDYEGFWSDLKKWVQKELGEDVTLNLHRPVNEFECYREQRA